jgi:hypothetical protein
MNFKKATVVGGCQEDKPNDIKLSKKGQMWKSMPIIPALGRQN